jgi:hypothetical protein
VADRALPERPKELRPGDPEWDASAEPSDAWADFASALWWLSRVAVEDDEHAGPDDARDVANAAATLERAAERFAYFGWPRDVATSERMQQVALFAEVA